MDASFGIGKKSTSILLIERNLVDVLALLASIEARDETSALVDRIEARHVYFFTLEEERSTQDRASADQQ